MSSIDIGKLGEDLARKFLEVNGYKILATNWRIYKEEIDIICEKEGILIFVEVKTRRNTKFGHPAEYVHQKKQKRLIKAAISYITKNKLWDKKSCRFDIVSVSLQPSNWVIEHFKNVFEISETLDSRHSYWQPW